MILRSAPPPKKGSRSSRLAAIAGLAIATVLFDVFGAPTSAPGAEPAGANRVGAKRPIAPTSAEDAPALPNVAPRRPILPAAADTNPIDLLLGAHLRKQGVDLKRTVSDALYARRVHLDLVGLLPTVTELDAFVADRAADKRAGLVRRLLARREDYAAHWLSFWNDLLRNEYRGTGYIDDGRRQVTEWLYEALYQNKRYDRFVHELISPVPGSEGFTKGIAWRGVVNASQRRELQAAQTTAQVFLGTNLKCASCHDSFTNQWTLADSHGLAATFSDGPLEIFRCDKSTGERAEARFLFPGIGTIDPRAPRDARMKRLADLMTDPRDGRLARTVVNRLWARLFGRGLVEPLENLDQPSWNPDLLDWLASDFADNGYDLKHSLELICTSRAYQLQSQGEPRPNQPPQPFRGPLVRRLTAEQFLDAVATVTGDWPQPTGDMLKRDGRGQGGQLAVVRAVLSRDSQRAHRDDDRVRASICMDDPLSRALGRPNREQVVSRRDSLATMLQALELTNGSTLNELLKRGARHWSREEQDPRGLVERAYRRALGRLPDDRERAEALSVVGNPPTTDGIEDLLWMITMLPEFQLIE